MSDDSDVMRSALRGLRRDSLRAQRRRDPGLMIAIGLAEPEEDDSEEPSGGVEEDEGGPNTPSGRHVESNEPTTGATAMRKAHARESRHQGAGQSNQNFGPSIRKQDEEEDLDRALRRALRR
jgi:hypothetical protein